MLRPARIPSFRHAIVSSACEHLVLLQTLVLLLRIFFHNLILLIFHEIVRSSWTLSRTAQSHADCFPGQRRVMLTAFPGSAESCWLLSWSALSQTKIMMSRIALYQAKIMMSRIAQYQAKIMMPRIALSQAKIMISQIALSQAKIMMSRIALSQAKIMMSRIELYVQIQYLGLLLQNNP